MYYLESPALAKWPGDIHSVRHLCQPLNLIKLRFNSSIMENSLIINGQVEREHPLRACGAKSSGPKVMSSGAVIKAMTCSSPSGVMFSEESVQHFPVWLRLLELFQYGPGLCSGLLEKNIPSLSRSQRAVPALPGCDCFGMGGLA